MLSDRFVRWGCHLAMGKCLIRILPSRTVTIAPRASALPATTKTCFISEATRSALKPSMRIRKTDGPCAPDTASKA